MTLLSQQERRVWTRQPQVVTAIRSGSGALFAIYPNQRMGNTVLRAVQGSRVSGNSSAAYPFSLSADKAGIGLITASGLSNAVELPASSLNAAFSATGEASIIAICMARSASGHGTGTAAIINLPAAGNSFWNHYPYSDGNFYLGPLSSNRYATGSGAAYGIYSPHVLIATAKSGKQETYINNVLAGTGSTAETPNIDPTASTGVGIGEFGTFYGLLVFDRVLSRSEIAKYSSNPWQLFTPRRTRRYISLGAGGATNYTATLTANVTSSAAIIKAAKAQRQANTSAAAAIAKAAATSKAATTTASAALTRSARLTRAATSTITGALATIKAKLLTLTATVTTSGTIARSVGAVRLATASASATIKRSITATKTATATTTGVIRRAVSSTKAATTPAAGTLRKLVSSTKAAATTLSGLLSSITTPFSGGGPFVQSLRRMFSPSRAKTMTSPDRTIDLSSPDRTKTMSSPRRDET